MNDHSVLPTTRVPGGCDEVLAAFAGYLRGERSLAPTTVENYLNQVRPFVDWYGRRHHGDDLAALTITDVHRFLSWRAGTCSTGSIKVAATALRTLLRWMFLEGRVDLQLAPGVGPVRYDALAGLPKALSAADLAALLAVEMSDRDRVLVLMLVRLGLRSREAAQLRLEDIDWRGGTVRVTGKGDRAELMPLPDEVGQALVTYLRAERRGSVNGRRVFLGAIAPYRPLDRNGVSSVVTRLAMRAGIAGRVGAHRLRHSAATAVLAGGGTLTEAGQLLRHSSESATAIYAKVDHRTLVELIRPWPTTTGQVI